MAQGSRNNDGPVKFVGGMVKTTKDGSRQYIWSHTFNIDEIRRELGTPYVNITVVKPRNARTDSDRTLIFKPSEEKYVRGNRSEGGRSRGYDNQQDQGSSNNQSSSDNINDFID